MRCRWQAKLAWLSRSVCAPSFQTHSCSASAAGHRCERWLDAVEQTLRSIASFAPATRVVLTYDVPASALSGVQREVRDAISRVVAQLGEPFVTAFEPIEIESLLVRLGYLDHEDELRIGGPQRLLSATVR